MNHPARVQPGNFVTLASGQRLHYAQAGEPGAPLVIFLHGFPQAWFAWEDQLALSGQTHFCIAPDMRGFNLSDKPDGLQAYRIEPLVNDVVELIASLGYQQADLIAHDWGGAVAWSVAISRPDVLNRLMILNAPHPVPFARALASDQAQQQASQYMLTLRAPDAEGRLLANNCAGLLRFFRSPQDQWLTAEVADRYRAMWTQPGSLTGALSYYRASPLIPPSQGHRGAAALDLNPADFAVSVPTTVVWGLADSALLPVLLEGLADLVSDLKLTTVEQASHWLIHEQPGRVAREIAQFLDSGNQT